MASDLEQEMAVSVIIPCYTPERPIRQCLDAILHQRTAIAFDITVVDSSLDATAAIVAREYPMVSLIRSPARLYAGAARTAGVRATSGPLCPVIDSDCIAVPALIDRAGPPHRSGRSTAVS